MDYTNTMRSLTKKIFTLALLASFAMTQTAFAQDASTTPSVPVITGSAGGDTSVVDAAASSTSDVKTLSIDMAASSTPGVDSAAASTTSSAQTSLTPDIQGSTATLQDTVNAQPVASSTVLENTQNPESATSTEATTVPIVDAPTSTPQDPPIVQQPIRNDTPVVDAGTSTLDVVAVNVDTTPAPDAATPVVAEAAPTATPEPTYAGVPVAPEPSQPEFTFALTGTKIPSVRKVTDKDGTVVGEESVGAPLTSSVDNTTGAVTVSGQCSDAYYVVLLFKNANDYKDDPRSYIVNRAYPCENGAFSYSISELPSTLPGGNYYLLVGQEGKTGTWKPVTELTEITITKNQ